jgi:D-alanyl-D-alanine carboxypeptidase/D-alanyl-D-alanine-endopeptidase (penicillin-binding protein 4)
MRVLPLLALLFATAAACAQALPPDVEAALARARLPRDAVTLLVTDVDPALPPRLSHRAEVPVNPASIAKLATTVAALDLLGPAFTWTTPVLADGPIANGTLQGNLYLQGSGDPKLVVERLWLLLRRVRALGIERVAGDIVLDHGAFEAVAADPGAFDGEPLRPYNATPRRPAAELQVGGADAGAADRRARPPAGGASARRRPVAGQRPLAAAIAATGAPGLRADFTDPLKPRLPGSYPAQLRRTVLADRLRRPGQLCRPGGGRLVGRSGRPGGRRGARRPRAAGLPVLAVSTSPSLSEVVRDINKYSNNVMAQQVFLTLGLQGRGQATRAGAREALRAWWRERIGPDVPAFDNGSGLSRDERITAQQLARLLQYAWASPLMPELAASLPVAGIDGTLRRTRTPIGGPPEERQPARRAGHRRLRAWRRRPPLRGGGHRQPPERRRLPAGHRGPAGLGGARAMSGWWVDWTGYLAAGLTTCSFVPQAWLTFRTRDVRGISLGMYSVFATGVALWLAYGLLLRAWPLVLANGVTLALALAILAMKVRYRTQPRPALNRRSRTKRTRAPWRPCFVLE